VSTPALALVIAAAFLHASWNLLNKRVGASGPAFVWLFSTLNVAIYLPFVLGLVAWQRPALDGHSLLFMVGSALLQLVYFLMLQQGYRTGDLSVVYPLARGTGPALATLAAIVVLGERPTALALTGALLVTGGVFLLSGGREILRRGTVSQAVVFGLLTGTVIALYTLWDKVAVSVVMIPPLLLDYATAVGRSLLLAPAAYHRRQDVRFHWQQHRREAIGIAVLSPLAYILVLTALTFAPVSYVAPAREISVLIAVLMGVFLLKEGDLRRRLSAAAVIVMGVTLLALP
jgi:drug/metabolite transporter (DMT)-like permease